jgi:hypothetical protein
MTRRLQILSLLAFLGLLSIPQGAAGLPAQEKQEMKAGTPTEALTQALLAACRQQPESFHAYLPAESERAFGLLPEKRKVELMRRLVAVTEAGKPLLSSGADGTNVVRCSSPAETTEMRLGRERMKENLAFVPVTLPSGRATEFGLVREAGGWRLLSVGLLMLNITELSRQWEAQDVVARELRGVAALRRISGAVETYRKSFGALPESLAQLGPAKDGASPETANLIDADLAAGTKDNYAFRYRAFGRAQDPGARYELAATPVQYGVEGKRSFYLDSSGVLRGGDKRGAVATEEDERIDEHGPDS